MTTDVKYGVPEYISKFQDDGDRDGKIAESHAGVVDKDAFENKIKTLLSQSSAK